MSDQPECKYCAEKIQWGTTAKGRRMPLDLVPCDADDHGAQVVFDRAGVQQCRPVVVAAEEIALMRGINVRAARGLIDTTFEAFTSHFATCAGMERGRR